MSERMNKERAREEIKMLYAFLYDGLSEKQKQALDIAIESLSNAEIDNKIIKTQHDRIQELKDNEWVDVRDRLPKDNERVLVYLKEDQMVHIGKYEAPTKEDIEWIKSDMYDDGITDEDVKREFKRLELMGLGWEILEVDEVNFECEVIAWKPLPQPYERKE